MPALKIDPEVFVRCYVDKPHNGLVDAYRAAGGGTPTSSDVSLRVAANAYKRRPDIRQMIDDEIRFRATEGVTDLMKLTPLAIRVRSDILTGVKTDKNGKQVPHKWDDKIVAKASDSHIQEVLKLLPTQTVQTSIVEHNVKHNLDDLAEQLLKLAPSAAAKLVEGEIIEADARGTSDSGDSTGAGESDEDESVHASQEAERIS